MEFLPKEHTWIQDSNLSIFSARWKHELGAPGVTPICLKGSVILFCCGTRCLSNCFLHFFSRIAPNMGHSVPHGLLSLDHYYSVYFPSGSFPLNAWTASFVFFPLHFMSHKGCLSCEELLVPWKETLQTQVILPVWLLRANSTVNKLGSGASQLLFLGIELSFSDWYRLPHS